MSRPQQKKSGSRARRKKTHVPRRLEAAPPPPRWTWSEPAPRTDGYLDDGPSNDEASGPWCEVYTVSRHGDPPFLSEDLGGELDTGCDSKLTEEEFEALSDRLWAEIEAEGRRVWERVLSRAELDEVIEDFATSRDEASMRDGARPTLRAFVAYGDTILKPTGHVILGWIQADRFAEALPRFAPGLDSAARRRTFEILAAFFRWYEGINPERTARLARDFDRLAVSDEPIPRPTTELFISA